MSWSSSSTRFLNTSRDGESTTPGQPVPMPEHSCSKEMFPDIQSKPPLTHPEAIKPPTIQPGQLQPGAVCFHSCSPYPSIQVQTCCCWPWLCCVATWRTPNPDHTDLSAVFSHNNRYRKLNSTSVLPFHVDCKCVWANLFLESCSAQSSQGRGQLRFLLPWQWCELCFWAVNLKYLLLKAVLRDHFLVVLLYGPPSVKISIKSCSSEVCEDLPQAGQAHALTGPQPPFQQWSQAAESQTQTCCCCLMYWWHLILRMIFKRN